MIAGGRRSFRWLVGALVVACAIGALWFVLDSVATRAAGASDLALVSVESPPASIRAGGTVTVGGKVRNRSDGTRAGRLTLRLSAVRAGSGRPVAVTTTLAPIGAGRSARFAVAVGLPRALPTGPYSVGACVEASEQEASCRRAAGALTVAAAEPARGSAAKRRVFQTIQGFGSSERPFSDPHIYDVQGAAPPTSEAQQDAVLDALYGQLGLTRVRAIQPDTAPGVGIEATDDNADPLTTDLSRFNFAGRRLDDHAQFVSGAKRSGARVAWMSPLNRERWMGVAPGTRDVAEYAEWLLAQVRRFRERGARLDYISVANEPTFSRNSMSGEFIRDVIKTLGPRLKREGLLVPFVVSDDVRSSAAAATTATVLADPVARRYVGALATHLYDEPLDRLAAMRSLARRYRVPLWMSEFSLGAMSSMRPAGSASAQPIDWALLVHALLTDYGVSAVDYLWGYVGNRRADPGTLIRLNFDGGVYRGFTRMKVFYYFGQYSRFVRPGAKRIAVTSGDAGVKVSAYRRGRTRTIVAINPGSTEASTTVRAADLAGVRRLRQVRTTPTENWAPAPAVRVTGTRATVTVPPQSVTTLTGTKLG